MTVELTRRSQCRWSFLDLLMMMRLDGGIEYCLLAHKCTGADDLQTVMWMRAENPYPSNPAQARGSRWVSGDGGGDDAGAADLQTVMWMRAENPYPSNPAQARGSRWVSGDGGGDDAGADDLQTVL